MNTEQNSVQNEISQKEEQQTITKTPPPQRVKNPKRVAQGKRLAAISKFAKQEKRRKREEEQSRENEHRESENRELREHREKAEKSTDSTTSLISSTGTILGTCCTLLLTYIAYTKWSENSGGSTPKTVPGVKKSNVVYNDLSKYDI